MTRYAKTPALETMRLRLRPRTLADLDDCLAMDTDPAVTKFIWGDPPDPAERRAVLEKMLSPHNTKPGGHWTVTDKATSEFLGWCGLLPLEQTGLIEIGYRFVPKAWGRGIATEAASRVLDHGFRTLELDPIVAVCHPENRASQRVLEKIGLARQGDAVHYGQSVAVYRLSRAQYLVSGKSQVQETPDAATRSGPPRTP